MFSSYLKRVIASVLLSSIIVTSNGFLTLASSVENFVNDATESQDNEAKNHYDLYYREEYYEESYLVNSDDTVGEDDAFIDSTENLDNENVSEDETQLSREEESETTSGEPEETISGELNETRTYESASAKAENETTEGESETVGAKLSEPEETTSDELNETRMGELREPKEATSAELDESRMGELREPEEATSAELDESRMGELREPEETTSAKLNETRMGEHASPSDLAPATSSLITLEPTITSAPPLLGAPGDPDWVGEHVHKACGVASGSDCVHTEYAAHGLNEGLDYKRLEFDDHFGEFIDDIAGWTMVGDDKVAIDHPEYYYLTEDVTFIYDDTAPTDQGTDIKHYAIDLQRDLYLCLNGHTLTNFTFKSTGNYKLVITDCLGSGTSGTIRSVEEEGLMFDLPVQIFGLSESDKIKINATRIAMLNTQLQAMNTTFYNVIFDGTDCPSFDYSEDSYDQIIRLYYNNTSLNLKFENCDFANWGKVTGSSDVNSTGNMLLRFYTTGTVTFNNVNVYNNVGLRQNLLYINNSTKFIFKGRNEFYNNVIDGTDTGNPSIFNFLGTGTVRVQGEGLFIHDNESLKTTAPGVLFHMEESGSFQVDEGATLAVDNNKAVKLQSGNNTVIFNVNKTFNCYGNLSITNNKVINCGESTTGTYVAALRILNGKQIKLGEGTVTIRDNKSYKDDEVTPAEDGVYLNHHMTQVYGERKDMSCLFEMQSGKKFNPASRIEGIGFPNGQVGKIMKWTSNEVDDLSIVSTVFKADNFYFPDYEVGVDSDYAKPVHNQTHRHKICGVAEGVACTHTAEIATHNEVVGYSGIRSEFTAANSIALLKGLATTDAEERLYLTEDIICDTVTNISLNRTVYLCLNGHSIRNIYFNTGNKNVKLYITNCGAPAEFSSENVLGHMFNCWVQVFGINRNIKVKSMRGYVAAYAIYNGSAFYSVEFDGTDAPSQDTVVFNVYADNATVTLYDVVIKNYNVAGGVSGTYLCSFNKKSTVNIRDLKVYDNAGFQSIVDIGNDSGGTRVNFNGDNEIYNNKTDNHTGNNKRLVTINYGIVSVNGTLDVHDNYASGNQIIFIFGGNNTFTVNEGGTFKFNNNILENQKKNMHIVDIADSANNKVNVLGSMEVIGNKVYNCNEATTGERIAALYKGDKATLTFGSGKITIKDNASYSDEGVTLADDVTYKGYHMYQVQSFLPDVGALFNMAEGKKFNPENRIEGISFRNGQTGNIMKWTSDEVDDPSIVTNVFTADTFLANFTVGVSGDYAVLISDDNHKHKICGIASTATCTHTEVAAHTDTANYTKLNDSLAFDIKVNMIAGLSAGESPAYLFLENDLTSDTLTTITLKRNVYICLNGHNMTNIRFMGDGKKIFITNCKDTKSVITEISSSEFVLRLNSEVYGKKVEGEYNLGINAHCIGLSYGSVSTEAKYYCVDVDGTNVVEAAGRSRFYLQNAGTILLEDVRIRDLNTASQVTFNHEGANGTLILKNIEMRNISYMNMGFIRINGANRNLIFKGYNKIHSNNITTSSGNSMEHMIHISNGKMTMEEGSTLEICDNVIPRHPNSNTFLLSVYTASTGAIDAKPGSTIYIHDNAIYKALKDTGLMLIYKNSPEQNLLGNIRIENNKFYNCNSSNTGGDYIAGLAIANGVTTNIGTGSIIIKDNNAYSDEGVTPAGDTYYAHHVYGLMSGNADLTFTQKEGTKFNTNSRIENIAFKGAVTGKIMKWTNETVEETELSKFSECFTADTYFVDDYVIKKKDDYVVVASFDEHEHKVCGVASGSACLHTEIAAHTDAFSYSKIDSAALSNVDNFIKIFTGTSDTSGELYVYLSGDITVTSVKTINPTRPVNLCLNGHMMSGFRFIGSNKVTVTNCKPEMGTFKEIIDTNICFQANTYLFGINKNLKINTSRIMDIGGSFATTNTEAMFYGTIFDGTGMNTGSGSSNCKFYLEKNNATAIFENCTFTNFKKQGRMFWLNGSNSKVVFKNVDVTNNSNTDYQFFVGKGVIDIKFKGRNNFLNNSMNSQADSYRIFEFTDTGATISIEDEGLYIDNTATSGNKYSVMFFSNSKLTVAERATLSITNTNIATKMTNGVNYMCEFQGTNTVIKGNLVVTDNKIRNCGTNNTSYIAALRLYNPITIGSGKIVVENNRAYKDSATLADDTAYPAQHMYQVLAEPNANGIFKVADGCKLNPESKLNGIAIYSADSVGKILEWNDTTYTNVDDHSNIFIPDPFLNSNISEGVESDGYVWLKYGDIPEEEKHMHMACGLVHGVASCSHTEAAEHTEDLEYHKMGDNVLKYRFANLMGADSGGKPMYFYLDKNWSTSDTQITLKNDLYICLNGFSLTGYRFYSANGSTVYITNCQHTLSKVENTTANNTILFRVSTQLFGIDKNIAIKSGSIIAHECKNVEFYDIHFNNEGRTSHKGTSIIHTSTKDAIFNIEDCKFENFETGLEMMAMQASNVTVTLKNTEFTNCNSMASRFFHMYYNSSLRNRLILKGENSIHDCISTVDNSNSGAAFAFENTDVIVKEGASFKYYNNQLKTGNRDCIMWFSRSNFTIEKNASFEVCDNLISQTRVSGRRTVGISISEDTTNKINVYGDFKVTGNKVANCTYTEGSYIAAVELRGGVINIGTGSVIIKDNTSGSNEDGTGDVDDTVRCQHMFNLYAANTENIFTVESGAKINPNSRIDATFFDTKDGKIVKWDDSTTDNLNAYRTIFTTDTYGDEEGMEVLLKDGYVVVASRDNEHWHKICGVATDSVCTHTLVAEHTDYHQYTRIHNSTTEAEFISLIQGASATEEPKYLFLKSNFTITGGKTIDLKRNVYLCLNGYSITNAKFTGNGKKIYICNCKEGVSSTIASNQDANIFARTGIEVYGIDKNITISSGRVIDVTDTYNNATPVFYDINMTGADAPNLTYYVFYFGKANANITFEKVNMDTYKSGQAFFYADKNNINVRLKDVSIKNVSGLIDRFWLTWKSNSVRSYWHFYGNVSVDNASISPSSNIHFLDWSGGTFNVYDKATLSFTNCKAPRTIEFMRLGTNGKLNINEGGTVIIDNNTIDYINNGVKGLIFLDGSQSGTELNVLGNLQITNNKYVNCGTITAGGYPTGLRIYGSSKTMKVGSGYIKIYGNRAYSDSEGTIPVDDITYPQHHFFEAYFDNKNAPIVQQAGTKFNATASRIENFSFSSIDYTGKIMKWTSNEVDESYVGRFHEVFKVDTYWDDDLTTKEEEGYGIVKYGAPNHKHKLCGVSTASACLHGDIVSHTEEIGYRKISNMYTSRDKVKTLLQTGGAFVLTADFDTRNLEGTGDQYITVTPTADLYICLNGHKLNGVRFVGGTNRNVYITNCQNTTSTFSNDITSHAMFNNISGEIYGIDKNIYVKYDVLSNTTGANNQNIRLYSASFSECSTNKQTYPYIALYQTSDQTSFIEDCSFSNIDTTYFLENDTARTFVFKDNTFNDMNLDRSFMDFDSGAVKVRWTGTNNIYNINYAKAATTYFMRYAAYAANEIKVDGNLKITNSSPTSDMNHFIYVAGGRFGIEENAALEIKNNTLRNSVAAGKGILYIGSNAHMYLHGTLDISDNRFTGTRKSHSDVGLWYANKTESIEIGSGSIIIRNNTTANANANVRNLYSYYGGETSEGSVISIFKQKTGTKFDAINSRIDSVAINSEEYTGVIYPKWLPENVVGTEVVNYDDVFIPDVYGGRKGLVLDVQEDNVIIKLADHFHKICGVAETEECKHTLIGSHGIGDTEDIKKLYTRLTWTSYENLRERLKAGGSYFLMRSAKLATPAVIDLEADLYLCLGNYYMENVTFRSTLGHKVYITSCIEQVEQPEEDEPEVDDEGNPIPKANDRRNDRNEIAIVATDSEAEVLFNLDVEVYSPYNILNIYANKLYANSVSTINHKVALNGVTFKNDEKTASNENYVTVNANNELLLDGVSSEGLTNVNNIIDATNTTVALAGNINVFNNTLDGSVINTQNSVLNQENGSINIYDNVFNVTTAEHTAVKVTRTSNIKGALVATSNEFIKTVSDAKTSIVRVYNADLNIGSEKINIADNGDAFGLYSDKQAFLKQLDTTSFNSENYIENIALVDSSTGNLIRGVVMANDNFTLSNEAAEKSFDASTASNADYRAYKGANNNIVIGTRKLNLDFNVPDGKTLLDDENYSSEYNIAGVQEATVSKATFRIGNYVFLGWATSKARAEAHTVDVVDGGTYDTPFASDNDRSQSYILYGVWVYNPHKHKICGTATSSECTHDTAHLAAHTDIIEYEPLLDTLTTLESGKGYNLIASSSESVKRVFNISGTVYICLNGYALYNVQFLPRSSTDKIVICNCSAHEALVTRNDESDPTYPGMFNHINTSIYGVGNRINFKTKEIIDRSGGGYNQTVKIYNAHFSPAEGFVYTGARALMYQENGGDKITISNTTFEGYTTTRLLSNHYDPLYGHGAPVFNLYDSHIIGNTITSNAAIHNDYGTFNIENVIFDDNILTNSGHLICQDGGSGTINIKNSHIRRTNISAESFGNIIYNTVGTTSIVNSTIEYNKASRIINAVSGNATIDETYINNNFANDSLAVSAINSAIIIGNSEIKENKFLHKLISIDGGTVNISEKKIATIRTNEIRISDSELDSLIYLSGTNPILNVKGNLIVKDNIASGSTIKTNNAIAAIGIGASTDPKINIGSGEIKIFNNKSRNDVSILNHMYGIYSDIERYMYQITGSTFNSNNYIEEIAIGDSSGTIRTGNIMANNNFTLDTSIAEKSFKASTISNAEYRAYKGVNESVVIGVRKLYLNFNIPEETTLKDYEDYETEYNIAGITKASISKATFKIDKFVFMGWATSIDRASKSIVDVKDGGVYDTLFDGANDKDQEFFLYGVWRYDDDPHIHKICGVATDSECDHDTINLSQHSQIMEYKPLFDYMTTLESGKAYYLVASSSVTRTFRVSGTVYICLNGFELSNVSFEGVNAYSRVYISNCKKEVEMTQNNDDYMFNDINVNIYGAKGRIKLKTKSLISLSSYSGQVVEIYNAHMSPKEGYVNDNTGLGIINQNNQNNSIKISNSVFEGYNTHILLLNNDSSHGGSLVGLYNVELKDNNITGLGIIFNNHGSFVVESSKISDNILAPDAHIIYQDQSGTIDIASSSIVRTNAGSAKNGNMIHNALGSINIANSKVENNNVVSVLNNVNGSVNISGNTDVKDNSVLSTVFNIKESGIMLIEEGANVNISNNELQISDANLDSVIYLTNANPELEVKGDLQITNNKATGVVTKTAKGIAAIGIENVGSPKINLGNGKLVVKDNISNNDTSTRNHMFGIYSEAEKFIHQLTSTTFNIGNYIEEIALFDSTGNLKKGVVVSDNNFTLSNEVAEKSFKASTISNVDFRAYKGTPSSVVIGVRKVYFDYNVPKGQTMTKEKIATVNMAGKVTLDLPMLDIDTEECVFLGWAYDKLEVGESEAIAANVKVDNGGTLHMPIDIDERTLYGVWKKNNVLITFEPNPPVSPNNSYKNELISELKTSTVSALTEVHNELLIMDSPYEITGYTFKGWALSTMSTVDADTYVLEPEYQPGKILTYDQVLAVRPGRKMTLYALWVRNTYTLTLHANDDREGNGSTTGNITGFTTDAVRNIDIRYDTYMSEQPETLAVHALRDGYNFSGYWVEEKDIAIKDRASYSETNKDKTWDNTRFYRRASSSELYALWLNKKYDFTADNRGQEFIDTTLDGDYSTNYYRGKVFFDDTLTLPNAKSNDNRMAFDYYGADVDKETFDILELSGEEYRAYKTSHEVNNKFTYYEEADRYGRATFSAVYKAVPVSVIFDSKESDAAFKDERGNYVKQITATLSYAKEVSTAFDKKVIATPYRPGYKVSKWVLGSDNTVEIKENTKWTYKDKTVVNAEYELVPYTIVYEAGDGEGKTYSHSINVDYETEVIPQYNNQFTKFGKKVIGFDILNGSLSTRSELTHKVSSTSITNWKKTNRVMLTDKFTNAYPSDGNALRLKAVYGDAGMYVRYHEGTPSSIDSRYINVVKGSTSESWIDVERESRVASCSYTVEGYEFKGWSKRNNITVTEAESMPLSELYQENQVIRYEDEKNDSHILDLYAVWVRKTYNWTFHINDSRESNGSTEGHITGLMREADTTVTIPVKYDEYFGISVATTGVARNGYTLKGFTEVKEIPIKDRAAYKDVYKYDTLVRDAKNMTLYTLWQNKTYKFNADLRGHKWENPLYPEGNIVGRDIYFDDVIDETILPKAKSTSSIMEFNYWGVNVDLSTEDILLLDESNYNSYKTAHVKNSTFTYYAECERDGSITFTAVYIRMPLNMVFDVKADDAGFKTSTGKYVKQIIATTSYGWSVGVAFDDGNIPTPYRPGYKVNRWVLASDSRVTITKDTLWKYESNTVVEPVYELIQYTIVYKPGLASGSEYSHTSDVNYESEVIPETNRFKYFGHALSGWKVLNSAKGIDDENTTIIARIGTNVYSKSDDVLQGHKVSHLVPADGTEIKFEAIWEEDETEIVYHKGTPSSVNSSFVNTVTGVTDKTYVKVNSTGRLAVNGYELEGYDFIGWSRRPISAEEADRIDERDLFKENEEVTYSQVRNAKFSLDLYAVWRRKVYQWTIHINDDRDGNGSTRGKITGLMSNTITHITVPVKYDEYFGVSVATTGTARNGYTLKGFARERNIEIKDKATYTDYFEKNTVVRTTRDITLYALWMNNKYLFNAELRGQAWDDPSFPDGDIHNQEIYFDDVIDGNILPDAKSLRTVMVFNYWGINIDKGVQDLLDMTEGEFTNYKRSHVKNSTFTYSAECERDGSITFTAVYMATPYPLDVIFDVKESDAAFKDNKGNFVNRITATTSYGIKVGLLFDDGEIPEPIRPGYKVKKWVLATNTSIDITKNSRWIYESKSVVIPEYEATSYIVEYHPGEAGGAIKQGRNLTYVDEFIPEDNLYTYKNHRIAGWKVLNPGKDISGNITMKVAEKGSAAWAISDTISAGYKATNMFPDTGNRIRLEAIWEESVYKVEYVRKAPNSVNARHTNIINELAMEKVTVETGVETVIANYNYTLDGYKMIGWSTKSDIDYNNFVSGGEESLIAYEKGRRVVLSNTKDETVKLYPVWKRNEYKLSIKYPKYSSAITKEITFRYDTYLNDIDLVLGRDYTGDAYHVLAWSLKDPGEACYSSIDEALADTLLTDYIANVNDKVVFRNQSKTLYSISIQDCIEFVYYINSKGGSQLNLSQNPDLKKYVLNDFKATFSIVDAVYQGYRFNGWIRDGELIPDKVSNGESSYFKGELKLNTSSLKKSWTYELVAKFVKERTPYNPGGPGGRGGGGGGGRGAGLGGNFTGWAYDLVGWTYYGSDPNSSMQDRYANGIFKIPVGNNEYRYYGFDSKGYMVTGFNNFYENTYYFNEDLKSIECGALSFNSMIMNGKEYIIHDTLGELMGINENLANLSPANAANPNIVIGLWNGNWFENPENGAKTYALTDGTNVLPLHGAIDIGGYWYVFDTKGEVQTGFIKYRDAYYYMTETGVTRGALYLGYKEIGGVNLYFDILTGGQLSDEKLVEQMVGVTVREYNKVPRVNKGELIAVDKNV